MVHFGTAWAVVKQTHVACCGNAVICYSKGCLKVISRWGCPCVEVDALDVISTMQTGRFVSALGVLAGKYSMNISTYITQRFRVAV